MKVGEYVRTKDYQNIRSRIGKIIKQDEKYYYLDIDENTQIVWEEDTVLKSSPNIIDLIEVGDYVNGEQVSRIKQCPEYHLGDGILIFNEYNETIYSNFRTSKYYDIKSIVTKEQFKSKEYRIGE